MFSSKFAAYFQNTFLKEQLLEDCFYDFYMLEILVLDGLIRLRFVNLRVEILKLRSINAQKMKFSVKDFFSKCD